MFRQVLVPVDFTEGSARAVDVAAGLVAEAGSITLLHVVQTVPGIDPESDVEFYERLEKAAGAKMEKLGERLGEHGIAWNALLVVGNRFDEILNAAEAAADLLVVSSQRIDFDAPETVGGTMSFRLALAAPCPVLLLK